MKSIRLWCLGAILLALNISSYAQDYEQGSGIAGCQAGSGVCNGPQQQQLQQQQSVQQQTPQPPPEKWMDRWGAIATDEPHGILGAVTGMSDKQSAKQAAMADCRAKGGNPCKFEVAYVNGCGVLVGSAAQYVVTSDATIDKAANAGMKTCQEGGNANCHVYYSACSPPVRIQ